MTSHLFRRSRWTWVIASVMAVALVGAVAALVIPARSQAGEDPNVAEITNTVAQYEIAIRSASDVPASSLPAVQEKVAALKTGESANPAGVLSAADRAEMNARFAAAISTYCTEEMAKTAGGDVASVQDATLQASAGHPERIVIQEPRKVMAVQVEQSSGTEAYAWAYVWSGDVYADGPGAQDWEVIEYRLVSQNDRWLIDASRLLGVLDAAPGSEEFGATSPHDSVPGIEMQQESELWPGGALPQDKLEGLEQAALAVK